MLIGGNKNAQENFFKYMRDEDTNNEFLCSLEKMLSEYFLLTKKYLIEKNAKLEMLLKIKKMKKLKDDMIKGEMDEQGNEVKKEE